jgi:hypothetical protein
MKKLHKKTQSPTKTSKARTKGLSKKKKLPLLTTIQTITKPIVVRKRKKKKRRKRKRKKKIF